MEEKSNNNSNNPMSPFCEALMDATAPIAALRKQDDCALVICTDGTTVASRQAGMCDTAVKMLFSKMKSDKKLAEIVLQAGLHYLKVATPLVLRSTSLYV